MHVFHRYSIPAVGYVPRRSQRLAQNSVHTGRPPVHPYRRSSKDIKISWIILFLLSCVTLRLPTVCINQVARLADGLHCLYCDILTIKILVYSSYSLLNHPQSRTQFS